jgi:ParB family transcriptional regulator, chromosome partitioning protein
MLVGFFLRIFNKILSMVTTKPKRGLGLGLEALLGPKVNDVSVSVDDGVIRSIKLSQLDSGAYQPRTRMDEGSLYELAESIKTQGIMQPILVRPVAENRFEIIAGERRSRAAKLAGLSEVPVLVREVPNETAAVMALIENIQREDLNPLEEAQGLARLVKEFKLTHEQAAKAVGRSRSAASNLLRLLNLTKPVQDMLMAGDLDMGHARALLPLEGAQQIISANDIVAKKLNVRDAEKLVLRITHPPAPSVLTSQNRKSRDLVRLEESLADTLAAKVEIRIKKRTKYGDQGEVAICFGSVDELNELLEKLGLCTQ